MKKQMIEKIICPFCEKCGLYERKFKIWHCDKCKFKCTSTQLKQIYMGEISKDEVNLNGLPSGKKIQEFLYNVLTIDFSSDLRLDVSIWYESGHLCDLKNTKPKDIKNKHLVSKEWLIKSGYKFVDELQKIK